MIPVDRTELTVPAVLTHRRPPIAATRHESLLEILARQRRVVMAFAGFALVCGLLYLLVATPIFTSTSRLYVRRGASSLLTHTQTQQTSDNDNFLYTQKEVISSTPVLALTLSSPGIHDLRTFAHRRNAFDYLQKYLDVEVGKKDQLVSVAFDSPYPVEADKIVSAVVKSYISFETDQRQRAAAAATGTLTADKATWDAELAQKSAALLAFRKAHGIVASGPDQSGLADQQLRALSEALLTARMNTVAVRSQYKELTQELSTNPKLAKQVKAASTGDMLIQSPEDAASIRQALILAQANARELERQYMPGHPAVRAAQERVDQLAVEQAVNLKAQLEAAEAKQADLQSQYNAQQNQAINQNAESAEDARMEADINRLEKLEDSVDSRIRELNFTADDSAVTISLLDPASTGDQPTKPRTGRTLGIALAAGLMCGACIGLMRDRYDRRLSSADDVRGTLGLEVLGELPAMPVELSPTDRAQQAHLAPESEMAQACRVLRTALLFNGDGVAPKTILVTSPAHGDGRTTVASNLAISLADAGKRVLLLDADLRSPMLDWVFGVDKSLGLAAAMDSDELVGDQLLVGLQPTGVPRLDVLPAGPVGSDPLRLLNSPAFSELLEKLADIYDHVVVDAPSTGVGPDTRILGAYCDGCLVVLREGQQSYRVAEQAKAALGSVGANVLGVVLNRVPNMRHGRPAPTWHGRLARESTSHGRRAIRNVARASRT